MRKFEKKDRSTFKYWFAHWCAFQMVALNLQVWKPKYLLHDIEKPWLKLFWTYKKVQKWHRTHNNHHLEYGELHGYDKVDWEALVIDWECSRFTKQNCPRTARQEANQMKSSKQPIFNEFLYPICDKWGI